jgi:hypothetical protein
MRDIVRKENNCTQVRGRTLDEGRRRKGKRRRKGRRRRGGE